MQDFVNLVTSWPAKLPHQLKFYIGLKQEPRDYPFGGPAVKK